MSTRHIHANFIAKIEADRIAYVRMCTAASEYLALMARLGGQHQPEATSTTSTKNESEK